MLRKLVSAAVLLVLCVGLTMAEEIRAVIVKVDGSKVTFKKAGKKGEDPGPEKTMEVADNVKVLKGKFNMDTKKLEGGDPIEGGLKAKMFSEIGEKGVQATIVTDDDGKKIIEIRAGGGRGGKKKDK